ncbi:BTAD domain-containing putative transcriptional regulator [Actinokineospora diospyrosa]|uniref:Two-component response regulator, SAPR family, consists of REC, wHTH and BTAD domains n=1 Tax=Actinokineospora diospyrosa TaxID=103728 RepID=A0ABT1I5R0_9PSEU|nr:BTAD domain-containing putative transcriptional regulator [Actinokineospora diospyrosa]MCP2267947.1 Two-component response regulator, SAPR family, consists of REC, wHTH and BTAD domains [Actinokineospora diospyrosa]
MTNRMSALARSVAAAAVLVLVLGGLPWALAHYIGWPLPTRVPNWNDITGTLLAPMSTSLVLDVLTCLAWWIWALFTLDVLRAARDVLRGLPLPDLPTAGPMRAAAVVLVGSLLVPLLVTRTPAAPTHVALAALATPATSISAAATPTQPAPATPVPLVAPPPGMVAIADTVRLPQHGVHDSLWRVADRLLGDGNRWPELLTTNRGVRQADGRALTNPGVIRPGWIITAFIPAQELDIQPQTTPVDPPPLVPEQPVPAPTTPNTPTTPPTPTTTASTQTRPTSTPNTTATTPRAPERPPADLESSESTEPVGTLTTGAYVSLGLIAAISTLVVALRMARRRRYRPGSGDRSDLARPIAPVVRAMRAHHDDLSPGPDAAEAQVGLLPAVPDESAPSTAVLVPTARTAPPGRGLDLTIDLARTRGIGLTGPGAAATARAMLLHLLAQHRGRATRVLIPEPDLALLGLPPAAAPASLCMLPTLDDVLDEAETELLSRTHRHPDDRADIPPLVLLATPAPHNNRRAQNIIDLGATVGIAAILIGHWRPGITLRVHADGTVGATSTGPATTLTGTRLYHLDPTDTADLLQLLTEAADELDDEEPDQLTEEPATETRPPSEPLTHATPPPLAALPAHQRLDAFTAGWQLTVLGNTDLRLHTASNAIVPAISPKHREILAYLAIHPDGVRRDILNDALWPDAPRARPFNALHNAVSTLRKRLVEASDDQLGQLVLTDDGRYRLDPALVHVDYHQLQHALAHPEPDTDLAALYRGDLAHDIGTDWIEPVRERLRRDVLDALSRRALHHADQPHTALATLEQARTLDPVNEALYCQIARLQATLGQHDAVARTFALLRTTLADIDQRPSPDTLNLMRFLQQRRAQPDTAAS